MLVFFLFLCSNHKIAEFYTENLEKLTADEIGQINGYLLHLSSQISRPLYEIEQEESLAKCVKHFHQKANSSWRLFDVFTEVINTNLSPDASSPFKKKIDIFKPTASEAIDILAKLMAKLETSQDGQAFAFGLSNAWDVYRGKKIAAFKEFKFLRGGSNFVGLDTRSMLIYDQLLPFNNMNHNDQNCVAFKDLPYFYTSKGRQF